MAKVIVIGAGISGLTAAHTLMRQGHEVLVLEQSEHAGGAIGTWQDDSFLFENGPNSFLDNAPDTLALCDELGLENQILKQSMRGNARYLFLNGKLQEVPTGPGGLYKTEILTAQAKRGLFMEPLRKANRSRDDESLASFIRRRLGPEVLDNMVTPFVSGVYAGDPAKLSLRASFPMLYDLEREYGSLLGGMIRRNMGKKKNDKPKKPRAKNLCSFIAGMQALPDAIKDELGENFWPCNTLNKVEQLPNGRWQVHAHGIDDYTQEADAIVAAVPSDETARLLAEHIPGSAGYLQEIPYNKVVVACAAYPKNAVEHPCQGFGYLVPRGQNVRILGSVWSSSLFPLRAPGGHHAFTIFLGGSLDPTVYDLSDDEIREVVKRDLHTTVGAQGDPTVWRVVRWPRAIPQYPIGHIEKVEALHQELQRHPGLRICGNFVEGISVNDCIRNARETANQLHQWLAQSTPQTQESVA